MDDGIGQAQTAGGKLTDIFHRDWTLATIVLLSILFSIFETTTLIFVIDVNMQRDNLIGDKAPLRNLLEVFYFCAGVAVTVIALWAASFARKQALEAQRTREETENARLSTVYMSIINKWNSDDLVKARTGLFLLVDHFKANEANLGMQGFKSPSEYVCGFLFDLKNAQKRTELRSYLIQLQFFEDLGLLCYKRYIRQDDVFDFLGASIETNLRHLRGYIARTRQEDDADESTYANSIYLYKAVRDFRKSTDAGRSMHREKMWQDE